MMKDLVALGVLLLPLVSWMWMCSGQKPVLVECSYLNFRAVAKRALFYGDELVGPDELFLGNGCKANRVRPDELEFHYAVGLCGIVAQVLLDGSVFHSWLTYRPKNRLISAELELQCIVPRRKNVSPDDTQMRSTLSVPPLAQHWFLVQYRYCASCACIHLRDNWSTPFYGTRNQSLQRPFYSSPCTLNSRSLCSWTLSNNSN